MLLSLTKLKRRTGLANINSIAAVNTPESSRALLTHIIAVINRRRRSSDLRAAKNRPSANRVAG
jgi:hypothetical protein